MGMMSEEVVEIKEAKSASEATVITVNCQDKTGLGCDICWIILEYGLRITRADISTDGKWCFHVFWVIPRSVFINVQWSSLKNRILAACPSFSVAFFLNLTCHPPAESPIYLLKLFCVNQKGLLHDTTRVLSELELLIHRVKLSTTPDGNVVDLIFISDERELMHTKARQDETCLKLSSVLGELCDKCEIELAGSEYKDFRKSLFSPVSEDIAEKLFSSDVSKTEMFTQCLSIDKNKIIIDNSLSFYYTLLQIHCADQKSLLYDILRTLKDCNIHVAYNRCSSDMKGSRELDLFIQQSDGKKILDPEKQDALCAKLRMEMLHPFRVTITNRGPDTELLVANPVEASGKGRPYVFYDVTIALQVLGITVFSAEIGRHLTPDRQWEVYRFLLDENCEFQLGSNTARDHIVNTVRKILIGW